MEKLARQKGRKRYQTKLKMEKRKEEEGRARTNTTKVEKKRNTAEGRWRWTKYSQIRSTSKIKVAIDLHRHLAESATVKVLPCSWEKG